MRPGKWSLAQQARVCQLLADQLQSGFSLQQALTFMRTTDSRLPAELQQIEAQLVAGVGLVVGLKPYLQENIYFQLRLTSHYGDLGPALARSATLLTLMATQRQRLRQLLAYPVGLLGGMGLLFATLQYGVMPQLQTSLAPTTTGPRLTWPAYVAIVAIIGFGITGVAVARWWWHQPTLSRVRGYLRWPLVGRIFSGLLRLLLNGKPQSTGSKRAERQTNDSDPPTIARTGIVAPTGRGVGPTFGSRHVTDGLAFPATLHPQPIGGVTPAG